MKLEKLLLYGVVSYIAYKILIGIFSSGGNQTGGNTPETENFTSGGFLTEGQSIGFKAITGNAHQPLTTIPKTPLLAHYDDETKETTTKTEIPAYVEKGKAVLYGGKIVGRATQEGSYMQYSPYYRTVVGERSVIQYYSPKGFLYGEGGKEGLKKHAQSIERQPEPSHYVQIEDRGKKVITSLKGAEMIRRRANLVKEGKAYYGKDGALHLV